MLWPWKIRNSFPGEFSEIGKAIPSGMSIDRANNMVIKRKLVVKYRTGENYEGNRSEAMKKLKQN